MMDQQVLYDLSPALRVMGMGLIVAMAPLAWFWLRNRHATPVKRLQVLTLITLFLTFDLVLFGAFTRLTDSGLGCPDWPGCYGSASPLGAHQEIHVAQQALPTGPVTLGKAWVEMIHRYLATGVGVLILVLACVSWIDRRRIHVSPWWPTFTLVWVCLQGAFGALTVTMKLFPAIVTLHLLGGLGLLALLRAQAVHFSDALTTDARVHAQSHHSALHLSTTVKLVTVLVWMQIALGGWVSTNYAVLACADFPTCQGSWWPSMDFEHGYALWRELGMAHTGESLPFAALTAIHFVHRVGAVLALTGLAWLTWRLLKVPALTSSARALMALMAWQLATGLSNVVFDWPLVAAVSHTGGAAALVIVLTGLWVSTSAAVHPVSEASARQPGYPA